jgi:cell division transport system permease protein
MISITTLRKVSYLLKRSFDGIRRRPWLHLLSVFTLAATFLSFTTTLQAAKNLDHLLAQWIGTAPMTVYLKEGSAQAEITKLVDALENLSTVDRAVPILPSAARDQFAKEMGAYAGMAGSLPESAFPASIDVHLKGPALNSDAEREGLASRIAAVSMVEEVELYDDWFDKLFALSVLARAAAWGLGLMSLVVAVLVVAAVVRAGVAARSREIEVLGLVGATHRYIRFPFQLEGAMETAVAMVLALFALQLAAGHVETTLKEVMPLIGLSKLIGLGGRTVFFLVAGSALVGLAGSRLSLRSTVDAQ